MQEEPPYSLAPVRRRALAGCPSRVHYKGLVGYFVVRVCTIYLFSIPNAKKRLDARGTPSTRFLAVQCSWSNKRSHLFPTDSPGVPWDRNRSTLIHSFLRPFSPVSWSSAPSLLPWRLYFTDPIQRRPSPPPANAASISLPRPLSCPDQPLPRIPAAIISRDPSRRPSPRSHPPACLRRRRLQPAPAAFALISSASSSGRVAGTRPPARPASPTQGEVAPHPARALVAAAPHRPVLLV
jgi:hypothetical protein